MPAWGDGRFKDHASEPQASVSLGLGFGSSFGFGLGFGPGYSPPNPDDPRRMPELPPKPRWYG